MWSFHWREMLFIKSRTLCAAVRPSQACGLPLSRARKQTMRIPKEQAKRMFHVESMQERKPRRTMPPVALASLIVALVAIVWWASLEKA